MAIKLLTVPEAAVKLGLSEPGVRHRIFHNIDGISDRAVVRLGRSVRLREDRLDQILEEKTGAEPFQMSEEWREKNLAAARNRESR